VRREAETLREAGFNVDVVCLPFKPGKKEAIFNDVHLHYLPLTRQKGSIIRYLLDYLSFFVLAAVKLTTLHLQCPFASIQVNNMPDFLVFATLIPRLLGAKIIMVMYEPSPELWATKYNEPYLVKLLSIIEQLSFHYAHTIFAVTEQMKQVFVGRGANPDKIKVILNATDSRFFEEQAVQPAKDPRYFTLICHGAIEERYGHDTMLQAIDRTRTQIPSIRLRILGQGSYREEFLIQVKRMGLEPWVQYLGWVTLSQMVTELASADAGIVAQKSSPYSNLVHTGKMYDYITFGLPVLASRLKAVEAYFGNDNLYFFEPGDPDSLAQAILDLYQHPDQRQKRIEHTQYLFYNQYNWEHQKQIYLDVYRQLVL